MTKKIFLLVILVASILTFSSCKKSDTPSPSSVQDQSFTVKGHLKTCAGSDVSLGLIVVLTYRDKIGYEYFFDSVHTGSFALSIKPVGRVDSIAVFGVDLTNLKLSDTFRYKLQDTLVNINTVSVCSSNVSEYFRFKVDNTTEQIYTPLLGDSLNLISWNYTGGWPMTSFKRQCYYNCKAMEFQFDGYSVGTFPVTGRDRIFIYKWYSFNMPSTGNITYTSYGGIGQYVTGTLYVPFIDNTDSLNHILTGSFQLKRKDHL
jgi:hypothetical protein